MNSLLSRSLFLFTLLTVLFPSLAHAHVGVGHANGLLHGFTHPVGGLDHICAMVAVGIWSVQRGGRAVWLMPLSFVGIMAIGGFLGMSGASVPFAEEGIVVSVLALGILIASAVRLPLVFSVFIVGLFAIFHGYAHGAEMPQTVSGFTYGAGFMLSTALLHAIGILIAQFVSRIGQMRLVRFAGGVIALCGVYLSFA